MKFFKKKIPRKYKVGLKQNIIINDLGSIFLEPDEQITFKTKDRKEYDFCRKDWGYYSTPSYNDRLVNNFFKTAIVRNSKGQEYVMVVEKNKMKEFKEYLKKEKNFVLEWLDERKKSN